MSAQAPRAPLALILAAHPSVALGDARLAELVVHHLVPMLEALAERPGSSVGWHFHGHLLDHLARHHEGFLLRLKAFQEAGQLEVLGGPFYGGAPALLSEADVRGQVAMAAEFWESFLGVAPRGCLLPDMAWAAEMPRLLHDTGLGYGVLSSQQVADCGERQASFGQLSRGGLPLYALSVAAELSGQLAPEQVPAWLDALEAAAAWQQAEQPGLPVAALLSIDGLGPLPNQGARTALGQLLDGVQARQLACTLPAAALAAPLQAVPMVLRREYAPVLGSRWAPASRGAPSEPAAALPTQVQGAALPAAVGRFAADHVRSWAEFPARFAAVDALYRRMLRASERLQAAIEQMEDEQRTREWSGQLATAQRALFRAQASEAFGAGHTAGFVDPSVRDATLEAICRAEESLDALLGTARGGRAGEGLLPGPLGGGGAAQGELRRAASLAGAEEPSGDDLFIKTADQWVWLEPRRGRVRSVEPTGQRHNWLDAWTSEGLTASSAHDPLAGGICDAVLPNQTEPAPADAWEPTAWRLTELSGPQAPEPTPAPPEHAEAGLLVRLEGASTGPSARLCALHKTIVVPAAGIGTELVLAAEAPKSATARYALRVPLRLPAGAAFELEINGERAAAPAGEQAAVEQVRLTYGGRIYAELRLAEATPADEPAAAPWRLRWQAGASPHAQRAEGGLVLTFERPLAGGFASRFTWQS